MPFAGYKDFDACVAANSDKRDPKAYCATIMRAVEGSLRKEAVNWTQRHYEGLAEIIGNVGNGNLRNKLADEFARSLRGSNRGPWGYNEDRFRAAASTPGYTRYQGGRTMNVGHSSPSFTRGHYEHMAETLGRMNLEPEHRADMAQHFADKLEDYNSKFRPSTFFRHVIRNNSGDFQMPEGYGPSRAPRPASPAPTFPAPRSAPRPEPSRRYLDAAPDSYYEQAGGDSSVSGDAMRQRPKPPGTPIDPIFGRKQAASTLPVQHQVIDPNNAETPQADQFDQATMFPIDPAFAAQWETGPNGAQPRGKSKEAAMAAALTMLADYMTRPHKSTDDTDAPYNSPATTPQPFPGQNSGNDGDYTAGFKDGQEDARNAVRPTFMDNSSKVSGYVKGYAQGYASIKEVTPFGLGGDTDTPMSMGGDSGQPMNSQEAGTAFQVSKASLQRHAEDDGVQPGSKGYKSAWERAQTKRHLKEVHHADVDRIQPDPESLERAEETYHKDPSFRRAWEARLRVSAAFISKAAIADADFRKGYAFGRRWAGGRLAARGSAAFEAGLYAGITDNPQHQAAWVREHDRLSTRHAVLSERLSAHEDFTRKYARANPSVLVRGLYVQAGTSTDLITDGPGTSPDPMGSTPLNGPGLPPPRDGQGDPARAGGVPPYQGAQPGPSAPAVPNDVMGQPQSPEEQAKKPAMGYSGPGGGYSNINLAPRAPDKAAQPGYSNPDADQGNPHHDGTRQAAFRATVQKNLQIMRERQPA